MKYTPLKIPEVVLMTPEVFQDQRGFFFETWRKDDFEKNIGNYSFVQDNYSKSTYGILRGLHFQIRHPQGKLARVTSGEVFDVAVDLRKSSLTFGKWIGIILSSKNKQMMWIPPGFAHGFCVLSHEAEFEYKCTDYYNPESERCIQWDDPVLNIDWPLLKNAQPLLSTKDKAGISFDKAEVYP